MATLQQVRKEAERIGVDRHLCMDTHWNADIDTPKGFSFGDTHNHSVFWYATPSECEEPTIRIVSRAK